MHLVHQSDSGNITVVSFLFETTPKDNPNLNRLLKLIGEDVYENGNNSLKDRVSFNYHLINFYQNSIEFILYEAHRYTSKC